MSKRRDFRRTSNAFMSTKQIPDHKLRNLSLMVDRQTIKSRYIPDGNKKSLGKSDIDFGDFKKQKLFNKNISHYRPLFNPNDSSQLPFMSSLRKHAKSYFNQTKNQSASRPFNVADKSTANMTIRKNISDLFGKNKRMSVAYYRWHNQSGVGNKQATNFECTLRDYNKSWAPNPEEDRFDNLIKPIKYQDVQARNYSVGDLVCDRQKKLFPMI